MNQERMRILKMLQEGQINAEEAEELLSALADVDSTSQIEKKGSKTEAQKKNKKHLRIIVNEKGKEKVNIALPLGIAKTMLNFVPGSAKAKLAENEINLDALSQSFEDLSEEKEILRVDDDDETVIIRVE
ncbi:SHOCT-like domain-containing protein [Halanaerobium hydrogeniformans]|uniref:YvlB/LiaX N-terminal domain-containing protein n=1 Tax=Halanaerobium hydrogeniformans TaxID=656519 RepID=E4RMU5_HALHG|nr:hypothetical protein [Halanaerobium hydrogeniformans]ADQ14162.1 hypothetical protein Halsa_0711 [Halanaerobium hydrogeniformans]